MKLKDVNLNIPHYLIEIGENSGRLLVTKSMRSEIKPSKIITFTKTFFIYPSPPIETYIGIPIVSLCVQPEEEILQGVNYVKFNLHYKYQHNYIAYDIAAVAQIIKQHLKKIYKQKLLWKIQQYKTIMKQLKQLN